MSDGPLVSITMAVHNGMPYLREAIESALGQTHAPIEVVVVDDASDDGSGDAARSFGPRVAVIRNHERHGIGASRNVAVERSRGEFLGFLDADDLLRPEAVGQLLATLEERIDLDMVFAHVREFLSGELSPSERARLRPPIERMPGRLPTQMLVRREAFRRVGPFETDLRRGVTLDWSARAFDAGLRYEMLDDVLFERRLHLDNNGLREREHTSDYVRVLKAAIDRRRANTMSEPPSLGGPPA